MLHTVSGRRVQLSHIQKEPGPYTLTISQDGKIQSVTPGYTREVDLDCQDAILMPGIVDCHVHLNEPGRTEWEGFQTGTLAATHGGVTTLVDMPLNSVPPTTTVANLQEKFAAASRQCHVDVGFYGGVIPGNSGHLQQLIESGVKGFKCFLIESGVDEFPCVTAQDLRMAFDELKGHDKETFLMFHAEMGQCEIVNASDSANKYETFLKSRPKSLENNAIKLVIELCREYMFPCHIVHLSSADGIELIRTAKQEGLPITVETCFHYLHFHSERIPDGATQYKCCPPIRDAQNCELLWQALQDGTIDYVVSDHSPCTPQLKLPNEGDFMHAWGGIASVQFGLQIMYSQCMNRNIPVCKIVEWLCWNTARRVNLHRSKGQLAVGFDADMVMWQPSSVRSLQLDEIKFKNKVSPYVGQPVNLQVVKTVLRGRVVYDSKDLSVGEEKHGQLLL